MAMKKIAVIASLLLSANLYAVSIYAYTQGNPQGHTQGHTIENDLLISNKTDFDLSFAVNGHCTKDFGTVHQFSIKTIPKVFFNKACKHNSICEVIAHVGKRCEGKSVGGVKYYFDMKAMEVISENVNHISVAASSYNIFFTQE